MITDATDEDWIDFWTKEDVCQMYSEYLQDIWEEMDQIEPLTPIKTKLLYQKIKKLITMKLSQ